MRKLVIMSIIMAVLLIIPIFAYADPGEESGTITLTLEDCMERAIEHNHQDAIIEQQIKSLWKQHNDFYEISNSIQQQLDTLDRYERLYDKSEKGSVLTIEEKGELTVYQSIFGPKPPVYSKQDMFVQFIRNRDFPHYSVWAGIQNLESNRKLMAESIKMGVKQLFDGLIDMQDAFLLQEQLYENMKKQNEQMLTGYNNGKVSEIDKYLSDCSLEKQRLIIEKFKRNIDNLEMALKQQTGIPFNQSIKLLYMEQTGVKQPNSYSTYLDKALENRSEVLTAKMDLQVAQRENDITRQYIMNELLNERIESDASLTEKQIAFDVAVNNVTMDISSGYKDVQLKLSDFYISIDKLQNAEKQYNEAELRYEKGLISLSELWNVEMSLTQARIGYKKAMRDCRNALTKLNTASSIGPGYTSRGY